MMNKVMCCRGIMTPNWQAASVISGKITHLVGPRTARIRLCLINAFGGRWPIFWFSPSLIPSRIAIAIWLGIGDREVLKMDQIHRWVLLRHNLG